MKAQKRSHPFSIIRYKMRTETKSQDEILAEIIKDKRCGMTPTKNASYAGGNVVSEQSPRIGIGISIVMGQDCKYASTFLTHDISILYLPNSIFEGNAE